MKTKVYDYLCTLGFADHTVVVLHGLSLFLVVSLLSAIAFFIAKQILTELIHRVALKSKNQYDDKFVHNKVFSKLAHLVPALVYYYTTTWMFEGFATLTSVFFNVTKIYIIVAITITLNAIVDSLHDIYKEMPMANDRPIKGYVQVVKIIFGFVAVVLILSILRNQNPTFILSGFGALAAVLMLVFRDTILGFVASIQLTANKMVKPGDWITMPKHEADGSVLEISLHTVKVQNFDKTIVTIPTYQLVSEAFKNWDGMLQSGGRRIKRSIFIDMQTIGFCTSEQLQKLNNVVLLRPYLEERRKEIEEHNQTYNLVGDEQIHRRRLTNIGVFRKYMELYLNSNPNINNTMTCMVRQLPPTEKGLPLEIYAFSAQKEWVIYEGVQSDVFDHLLAIAPEFGLLVFQGPSGHNLEHIANAK